MPTRETIEDRPAVLVVVAARAAALPERDVRRKRPPALSFLLRMDTLRRIARACRCSRSTSPRSSWPSSPRWGSRRPRATRSTRRSPSPGQGLRVLRLPRHRAAVRQGRALRRPRRAPGLSSIVASLFQVTVVVALYAIVSGQDFSSYYIFYGSLFFAVAYVSTFRFAYERTTGLLLRAAGYQRRAVLVGTGEHIEDVAHALRSRRRGPHQRHRLRVAGAAARQRADLAGHPRGHRRHRASPTASTRSSSPTPSSPSARRSSSSTSATSAASWSASRRRRWRSSSTAPSSSPGSRSRSSSSSRRSSRASTTRSSARSTSSARCSSRCSSARC